MSENFTSLTQEVALQHAGSLLSVGSHPESRTDLLAIGSFADDYFFKRVARDKRLRGARTEVVDDAIILSKGDERIGVAYDKENSFYTRVSQLARGNSVDPLVKPWTLTPWLPEAFGADLSTAVILKDDIGIHELIEQFETYPEAMGAAIIERARQEIRLKEALQANETITPLERIYSYADISLAGMRIVHASQEVYFRGVRYLNKTLPLLDSQAALVAHELTEARGLSDTQRRYLGV